MNYKCSVSSDTQNSEKTSKKYTFLRDLCLKIFVFIFVGFLLIFTSPSLKFNSQISRTGTIIIKGVPCWLDVFFFSPLNSRVIAAYILNWCLYPQLVLYLTLKSRFSPFKNCFWRKKWRKNSGKNLKTSLRLTDRVSTCRYWSINKAEIAFFVTFLRA